MDFGIYSRGFPGKPIISLIRAFGMPCAYNGLGWRRTRLAGLLGKAFRNSEPAFEDGARWDEWRSGGEGEWDGGGLINLFSPLLFIRRTPIRPDSQSGWFQ